MPPQPTFKNVKPTNPLRGPNPICTLLFATPFDLGVAYLYIIIRNPIRFRGCNHIFVFYYSQPHSI